MRLIMILGKPQNNLGQRNYGLDKPLNDLGLVKNELGAVRNNL